MISPISTKDRAISKLKSVKDFTFERAFYPKKLNACVKLDVHSEFKIPIIIL